MLILISALLGGCGQSTPGSLQELNSVISATGDTPVIEFAKNLTQHLLDTNAGSYEQSYEALCADMSTALHAKLAHQQLIARDKRDAALLAAELSNLKQTSTASIDKVSVLEHLKSGAVKVQAEGESTSENVHQRTESRFSIVYTISMEAGHPKLTDLTDLSPVPKVTVKESRSD